MCLFCVCVSCVRDFLDDCLFVCVEWKVRCVGVIEHNDHHLNTEFCFNFRL